MVSGKYVFFSIQQRVAGRGAWCDRDKPVAYIPEAERYAWAACGRDRFGRSLDPWGGLGNDARPVDLRAHGEMRAVREATGEEGWWSAQFALQALDRVRQHDAEGLYDARDGYGQFCRYIRHEFRLVKVEVVYERKEEVALAEHLLLGRQG